MSAAPYRVAVVGATGQVGGVLLELLELRAFPLSEVVAFASERSVGRVIAGGLVVRGLRDEAIQGFDLALFSAGGQTSREWAPRFAAAGAVVVDNSSAFRMDPSVPLVVSEVNPDDLSAHRGIVANPNCSTMQMVVALRPIQLAVGIERLVVTTFQAVSGTGKSAVDTLRGQAARVLAGEGAGDPGPYAHQIAFNVLPHAGAFAEGDDHTDEERKLIDETRKILGDDTIRVSPTCVRVPVVNGHSESVTVETRAPLSAHVARELLRAAPGLVVADDPAAGSYPMAVDADGADPVYVGRIRQDPGHPQALSMWIVADNLRKGAALNAVQLAEVLHDRGLVGARVA